MENKTGKYFKYAIGEIILVVIGILIALQINNWNKSQNEKQIEKQYLKNIVRDLEEQIKSIEVQMENEQSYYEAASYLIEDYNEDYRLTLDSTFYKLASSLTSRKTFVITDPTYTDLISSGNINIIRNQAYKDKLLNYYQELERIEKIIQKKFIHKEVPSGIEICEVQLFHLANKIKQTEINHDIDTYLPNINEVLEAFSKEELIKNVFDNQDRIIENRDQLERLLVRAHVEAGKAWELGATEAQMKDILHGIRLGQWRWDYAAASHGGSFHAPVELGRVLGKGIDVTQETRIKLAKLLMTLGFSGDVPYPAIETKADAQKFIGLPMEKMEADKARFLKELAPEWDKEAAAREAKY